jgi:ABC-type phosphate/phosphonate transport system substrate-binding protein
MIASLPMYDNAATHVANNRFWQAIRTRLGKGPAALDRDTDPHVQWLAPDLIVSQTCSLPYRTELKGKVRLVGTPDYGVKGCPPGYYNSCIVVRREDPRRELRQYQGARLARNDIRSQSGWAALEQELAERGYGFSFENNVLDTGGHAASAQAVARGEADLAAIDAVTWALLCRDDRALTQELRLLETTKPTPGLPLITSMTEDPSVIFKAVAAAIADLTPADREVLMLKGLKSIAESQYLNGYITPA